jgi:hypothetical protein
MPQPTHLTSIHTPHHPLRLIHHHHHNFHHHVPPFHLLYSHPSQPSLIMKAYSEERKKNFVPRVSTFLYMVLMGLDLITVRPINAHTVY